MKIQQLHRVLFLLAGLLLLPGCTKTEPAAPVRVACIGDSVTYGYGLNVEYSYPSQLAALLGDGYLVENFGVNGAAAADYTATAAWQSCQTFAPDIAVILLGSNDTVLWTDEQSFVESYRRLLSQFPADTRLLLCTPPYAYPVDGIYQFGVQPEALQQVCQCIKQLSSELGLELVDLQMLTDDRRSWFSADGVHPNADGAAAIADAVAAILAAEK